MRNDIYTPASGLHSEIHVPSKVRRRGLARPVYNRRLCRDDRNYVFIPFTIQGVLTTGNFGPMWKVDRNYWIARIILNVGRHDDATHPADGTPSGAAIVGNMRRVTKDLSGDAGILANDSRLKVAINHHQDVMNDDEEGDSVQGDFAILMLTTGEHIYPRLTQVGSGRPGTAAVMTAVLVPVP